MLTTLRNLICNDDGAIMMEHGVIVALIAAVCIAVVFALGQQVSGTFSSVSSAL